MTASLESQLEGDFIAMLDEFHSLPEIFDDSLDQQLHQWYADALQRKPVFPKQPYFSPSSANSCPRELYMKQLRAKKDAQRKQPHQGRWQRIGTNIGDMIQRDLLFIEKHFEAKTGNKPPFVLERNERGEPMFEDFAKKNKRVSHNGRVFHLFGTPDGVLRYTTDEGKEMRVGLEVKSKQTTAAQTSLYKMKAPKPDHAWQVVSYAEMYDLDYYLIVYVNAAKQGWVVDDEKAQKTPDIRAFCQHVTDEDKTQLFDFFTEILAAVQAKQPPKLDLWKFSFNDFKTSCALSLTDEELTELKGQVEQMLKSQQPEWKKRSFFDAWQFIQDVRGEGEAQNE